MKIIAAVFFFFLILSECSSQTPTINNNVRSANLLNQLGSYRLTPGDNFFPISSHETSKTLGDVYLDFRWSQASLQMYENDNLVNNYLIRYDINNNEFEFRLQSGVKILPGKKVKNMIWIDSLTKASRLMINAREYKLNGVPLEGFFEVLVEAERPLLKKTYLEILRPNFSPALNVGSKDSKIIKKNEYFYLVKNDVYQIKNKNSFTALQYDMPSMKIEPMLAKESIKLNKEGDLRRFFYLINAEKK